MFTSNSGSGHGSGSEGSNYELGSDNTFWVLMDPDPYTVLKFYSLAASWFLGTVFIIFTSHAL
jgi:hypothetical protein